MKIVFQSYAFYPSSGGIESSAELFSKEFRKAGCQLRIHTMTELDGASELPDLDISRPPSLSRRIQDLRWADVIYQHNPSLRLSWPSLAMPHKAQVISVHTWIRRSGDERISLVDRLKRAYIERHRTIANSKAIAADLGKGCTVIENTYDDGIFKVQGRQKRDGMAFVGRLVSDKGCITAVEAASLLKASGSTIPLHIIGSGPEESELRKAADRLGLSENVYFHGRLAPAQIATVLNSVKYIIIPSLWAEPFGIVALEGIACGAIPIATNRGGLVDAVGSCGPFFDPGNAASLARHVQELESNASLRQHYASNHSEHLDAHRPKTVVAQYLKVFEDEMISKKRRRGRK